MFKKSVTATLAILISFKSFSYDGKINFEGNISKYTCSISSESKNLTVQLPTISVKSFNEGNNVSGLTDFSINIENCDADTVYFYVDRQGTNVHPNGITIIPDEESTNVGIVLFEPKYNAFLPLNLDIPIYYTEVHDGKASLDFTAAYFKTGVVNPGKIKALMSYRIEYG